jgi:uncharacterized protein YjbI with pentapeptide repeats
MSENLNQPREDAAVLGGQSLTSMGNVVLGGIEGVKWRLGIGKQSNPSSSLAQRIAALSEALNYGQSGLDLLIQALDDDFWQVHQAAYSLLENYAQTKVKQALERYRNRLAKELLKCYEAGERNFQQAHLNGLYLQWADLDEANFSEANLSQTYLNRAYLSGTNLIQANLSGANLSSAELIQANLNEANLSQAHLNSANLNQANLREANLRGADLNAANLNGVNLSEAILSWVNLSEANLSHANLSGANLVGSNLTEADLSEANLSGAKLKGVNLTYTNLVGAYYNDNTDFPTGFGDYSQLVKRSE